MGMLKRGTPLATEHPSIVDIAWAAGIYEGEGFCRYKFQAVSVGQNDPWILHKLQRLFGGTVKCYYSSRKHPEYRWAVSGSQGRGFLMTIYPFLSPKRQAQARQALGYVAEKTA